MVTVVLNADVVHSVHISVSVHQENSGWQTEIHDF